MEDTSTNELGGQIKKKRCSAGHELPVWGGDQPCQMCRDIYIRESDAKRTAIMERDVVTREKAHAHDLVKQEAWLAHTADWKDINTGLVKAADRQADALEKIASHLEKLATRA
jgi:hypothetical protein